MLSGVSVDGDETITLTFKRFMRSLALTIDGQDRVVARLNGRSHDLSPFAYRISYHPLICIRSLVYNRDVIVPQYNYPSCQRGDKLRNANTQDVTVYQGETIALSELLPPEYSGSCGVKLLSRLTAGHVDIDQGEIIYEQDLSRKSTEETMNLFVTCDGDSGTVENIRMALEPAQLSAQPQAVNVDRRVVPFSNLEMGIARLMSRFSRPVDVRLAVIQQGVFGTVLMDSLVLGAPEFDLKLAELLSYKMGSEQGERPFNDTAIVRVTSAGALPLLVNISFSYTPRLMVEQSRPLMLPEGGATVLMKKHLSVNYGVINNFIFTILDKAKHIKVVRTPDVDEEVSIFTSAELNENYIQLVHDGSETLSDDFTILIATPSQHEILGVQSLQVEIIPDNNNAPRRIAKRPIEVVIDMETVLTPDSLSYVDDDSQQMADDIVIKYQPDDVCGKFRNLLIGGPVYRFTQADIDHRRIVFRQSGAIERDLQIQVSDGKHFATDRLKVKAVNHTLGLVGSTRTHVDRGGSVALDNSILNITTNTGFNPTEIMITVSRNPKHGRITLTQMTYADVIDGNLLYDHDGSPTVYDSMNLMIRIGHHIFPEVVRFIINTDLRLLQPNVQTVRPVIGHAYQTVKIDTDILSAHHQLAEDSDILYQIPNHQLTQNSGYFANVSDLEVAITRFTQHDVTEGYVSYLLGVQSEAITILVSFRGATVDVVFRTVVVDHYIPLQSAIHLQVREGGALAIPSAVIQPEDSYVKLADVCIDIITQPAAGKIVTTSQTITYADLDSNVILYRHNGSETLGDSFVLQLKHQPTNITSSPVNVSVVVSPVNNHRPTFNASGELLPLQLWAG